MKKYRESTLPFAVKVLIISALFVYFSPFSFSQSEKIITRNLPLTFENSYPRNRYWYNPISIIDDDPTTFSIPTKSDNSNGDGSYYNIFLKRPVTNTGALLDSTDYGTILKVQIKLTYNLEYGFQLTRCLYVEFEGLVQRIQNAEIKDANTSEKIMEYNDVAQAVKNWYFKNPLIWEEILLRFGCEDDYLSEETFCLFDVSLSVIYVQKSELRDNFMQT